jgi:hypothetical protein
MGLATRVVGTSGSLTKRATFCTKTGVQAVGVPVPTASESTTSSTAESTEKLVSAGAASSWQSGGAGVETEATTSTVEQR